MANSESKSTVTAFKIKEWAEQRDGKPAVVKGTDEDGAACCASIFPVMPRIT